MMIGSMQVDASVQYAAVVLLRLRPVWLDANAIWFRGIFGNVGSRIKTAAKEEWIRPQLRISNIKSQIKSEIKAGQGVVTYTC